MSMRKKLLILLVSGLGLFGFAQSITEDAPSEVKLPFRAGDWFEFRIHYGFFKHNSGQIS